MSATPAQPDLDLLRRFQDGDAAAFTEIVNAYSAMVYTACRRVTRDPHRAEDLTQETFFKLSQRPYEVTRSLGAWLHRVATHLAIDSLRREGTRTSYELRAAQHAEQLRDEAAADPEPTWAAVGPKLDAALAELPDASRDIIVRHFLMQQSQRQIAQDTGMSQPTVSRRVAVALEQLRKRLGQSGVIAGAGALGLMLQSAPAHAAPATVAGSSGGMSLLSQVAAASPPIAWGPVAIKAACIVLPTGGFLLGVGLLVSGLAASFDQAAAPPRATAQQRLMEGEEQAASPRPQADGADLNLIFTVPERHAYNSTYISAVTLPPPASDQPAQVVYADGHVRSIDRADAVNAIEQQLGKPIERIVLEAGPTAGGQP